MASLDGEPLTVNTLISDMLLAQNNYWQQFVTEENHDRLLSRYHKMSEQEEYKTLEDRMQILAQAGEIQELDRICKRLVVLHNEMVRKSALQDFVKKWGTGEANKE